MAEDTENHPAFAEQSREWLDDLALEPCNFLRSTGSLSCFSRDRGVHVAGSIIEDLRRRNLLGSDAMDNEGNPLFHPFRFYPLHCIHKIGEADSQHGNRTKVWNEVADLAILLEPIYWPQITGWAPIGTGDEDAMEWVWNNIENAHCSLFVLWTGQYGRNDMRICE